MDDKVLKLVSTSAVLLAGTGLILWIIYRSLNSSPKKIKNIQRRDVSFLQSCTSWEKIGKLRSIMIYPIKSCAGILFQEAIAEKVGLRVSECRDRCLVITDANGDMMTARKWNSMVTLTSEYDQSNNSITMNFPHLQPIKIYLPLIEIEGNMLETKIWGERVSGFDCGDEAADWLSLALGCKCRLMYHGSLMSRRTTESHMKDNPLMNPDDNSLYADLTGFMLMTDSSIADLEKKTAKKLPFQNFRPNFLVEGLTAAYDEDDWTYIKIGEAIFRNTKPCDRCSFPTINYQTGVRDKHMEPLKTLRKYRCPKGTNDPHFGINLGIDKVGKVKVGDEVFVLRN